MRVGWVNVEWEFQRAIGDLKHGFTGGQERIVEAAGELLFTGHAEPLSQTSQRASAPFPMPLCRGTGRHA